MTVVRHHSTSAAKSQDARTKFLIEGVASIMLNRVMMLNAESPLIPENQVVSEDLIAAHELVRGLTSKLQR